MFIQTEITPNPATLKFLPGRDVMGEGTANFTEVEQAGRSPLAQRLFELEGIVGVFLGSDFVTVTKSPEREWEVLKPVVLAAIMDHFTSGQPVLVEGAAGAEGAEADEDDEITAQKTASSTCTCRVPVPDAPVRRQRCATASRTC